MWVRGGDGCCDCLSHSFGQSGEEPRNTEEAEPPNGTPLALSAVPDPCSLGVSLGVWGDKEEPVTPFIYLFGLPQSSPPNRGPGEGSVIEALVL